MAYACRRSLMGAECDGCGMCQKLDCGYDDPWEERTVSADESYEERRNRIRNSVCDCPDPFPRRKDRVFRLPLLPFGRSLEAFSLSAHR